MTPQRPSTEAVAAAVLATPGVAFLRPGLSDLLRASAGARMGRLLPTRPTTTPTGIRITPGAVCTVDIHLVLRRDHRALDVTRAVRTAVTTAIGGPAAVTVTVTGVV